MKLSLVIPAHNEAGSLPRTLEPLCALLDAERVPHEVLVVNDHSRDATAQVIDDLARRFPQIRRLDNPHPTGFGYAVRAGLERFTGDAVCVVMADASDDPRDVVAYVRTLEKGYDCAFGSRFVRGSRVVNYPPLKLALNRLANLLIKILFWLPYNDVSNAFKAYRREVIAGVQPILSCHFNLTVELPLKAIVRGYSYGVVPIRWHGRVTGASKLKIKEMGGRYLFIVLYALLEKWLSRGDYRRREPAAARAAGRDG